MSSSGSLKTVGMGLNRLAFDPKNRHERSHLDWFGVQEIDRWLDAVSSRGHVRAW